MVHPAEPEQPSRRGVPRLGIREVYALVVVAGLLVALYLARGALAPYLVAFLGVVFALPVAAVVRALIVYGSHRFDGHSPDDALRRLPIFEGDPPPQEAEA